MQIFTQNSFYFVLKSVHYCIGVWLYFLLFTVKTLAGLSDEEDFCDVVDCLETLSIEKCMIVRNALSSSSPHLIPNDVLLHTHH